MTSQPETEVQRLLERLRLAERRAIEAEQQARNERKRTRRTTFEEFIRYTHEYLAKPLEIQTDKSLTTKGSITSPDRKLCPTYLKPWEDFPETQQQYFDRAYSFFSPTTKSHPRIFPPVLYLEELGRHVSSRKIGSEKDLESYERFTVENHVTDIVTELSKIPNARDSFGLSCGIVFENHSNTLNDTAEEVQERFRATLSSTSAQVFPTAPKPLYADQICVYKNEEGACSLLLIEEYKAPHKLSVNNLRAGLRPMNLPEEVINRAMIPTDQEERLNYNADRLVAAAVTQTFSQMIENGLAYSCISTGEARVFLHIREDDPTTVYYHQAEPNQEAEPQDEHGFRFPRSTLSQMLSFCLMAMQSFQRDQTWRSQAVQRLSRWQVDYEAVLRQIPEKERKKKPRVSCYRNTSYPINLRSPYFLRNRRGRKSCSSNEVVLRDHSPYSSDDTDRTLDIADTPSKGPSDSREKQAVSQSREVPLADPGPRTYCTQACLLGLTRRRTLDECCPNVSYHRQRPTDQRHPINAHDFRRLVRHQLGEDLDHDCEPLGKQGARGALFKIILRRFGYVLVAKGTVRAFVPDLQHEGEVYQRLSSLQGSEIPVYMGSIDLPHVYYLDVGVRIQHMMMMAWGGDEASTNTERTCHRIDSQVHETINRMLQRGVEYCDVRPQNTLWNTELQRAMLIDFERAVFVQPDPIQCSQVDGYADKRLEVYNSSPRQEQSSTSPSRSIETIRSLNAWMSQEPIPPWIGA